MKRIQLLVIAAILLAICAGAADAQRRRTPVKKPPATVVPPLDVRAAREKVDNQLANVNKFIEVLGPIAQQIEDLDAQAKSKPLRKDIAGQNEANKQKVIAAIRNLKDGLATLESEFRTKTVLQKYLPTIQGITDLAAQAEDSAIAGKFVAAKEPLRGIAKKLTDTLAVMPVSLPQ